MKVFYTFGSDDRFPFCGGWVEVEAPSMKEAHAIFRANYPDRQPGILNCSDYYTESQFKESDMLSTGNRGGVLPPQAQRIAETPAGGVCWNRPTSTDKAGPHKERRRKREQSYLSNQRQDQRARRNSCVCIKAGTHENRPAE